MISPQIQKLMIIALTLGLILYIGLGLYNSEPAVNLSNDVSGVDTTSQDILTLVDKLQKVSIDQSVFTSTVFLSLMDYSAIISPEIQGRPNPFAPIGVDVNI